MNESPIFLAGHSLGGGETLQYAFSRLKRGLRVDGVYAFAPPRPGDNYIGEYFATQPGVIFQAFRNHRDPVPELPINLKFLHERYEQPLVLTELNEPGSDGTIFADHHIVYYVAGVGKLKSIDAPVSALEAAQACADLYTDTPPWHWQHNVDGQQCAIRIMPNGARLLVFMGTKTPLQWLHDFDALQINLWITAPKDGPPDARVSRGFWAGVGPIEAELDAQLA